MLELFDGRFHGGAGRPDDVKKNIGMFGVKFDMSIYGVGGAGLFFASISVGAHLNGVFGANEEFLDATRTKAGKMVGDK